MIRAAAFALVLAMTAPAVAAAADHESAAPQMPLTAAIARAAADTAPALPAWAVDRPIARGATLPALYGTYAALQVLDIVSTKQAIAAGAREQNPLMRGGNTGAMLAVKAAAGVGTIYFAERAWKKNKTGAIVLMAVLNGATAAIAAHNLHNARR
jgi:hypothetical protein